MTSTAQQSTATHRRDQDRGVVVGLDGTETVGAALGWAIHQALGTHRRLILLFVLNDYAVPVPHHAHARDDSRGLQALARTQREVIVANPGLRVQVDMVDGGTVSQLLARSADQELLVVGRRGLGAWGRVVEGSTSIALTGRSKVPVVVVPDEWRQADHSNHPVVVGVDVADPHAKPLRFAFAQAARRGVGVHVVAVVAHEPALVWDPSMDDHGTETAVMAGHDRLTDLLEPVRREFPDVPVHRSEVAGSPVKHLMRAGRKAQLIVLGRHREGHMGLPVASVTRGVLHHTDVPVAVVPC